MRLGEGVPALLGPRGPRMAALARPTPGVTTDVTTESMAQETFVFIPRVLVTVEDSEDLAAEGRVPERLTSDQLAAFRPLKDKGALKTVAGAAI